MSSTFFACLGFPLAGLVAFACTSEPTGADGAENGSSSSSSGIVGTDAAGSCRDHLPASLSVSEGGLLVFPRVADATYEGLGGAVVTVGETDVRVRVPLQREAGSDLGIRLACGEIASLTLRPLGWTSLATWQENTGAKAREYGGWWLDPEGGLVVYGGYHYQPKQFTAANDVWRFDFGTSAWTALAGEMPFLPGGRAAPIPNARAVLYFGGSKPTDNGSVDTEPSLYRFDYDASRVTPTKLENLGDVLGSYTGSLVYDSKRARWISLCGVDSEQGLHCKVDAYTLEGGFVPVATTGKKPAGRFGFAYAYDEATDRVLLFGGSTGDGSKIDGETWALDLSTEPATWTMLFANGDGASKRRNGAFALDPVGHRLLLWGGTPDGRNSVPGLRILTLDRGAERWLEVETPEEVPSRTSGIGIHDAARGRVLFGFGNDDAVYRDLWALDTANDE